MINFPTMIFYVYFLHKEIFIHLKKKLKETLIAYFKNDSPTTDICSLNYWIFETYLGYVIYFENKNLLATSVEHVSHKNVS